MVADASNHGGRVRRSVDASALAHTPPPDMGRGYKGDVDKYGGRLD